ncbi:VirB8/TrbF family protein [Sphingomonas psychrotolerans]|uniref:VirB8/TrbF family protein n=1 Tax=Sphingomonas psychrotolerans TaxID=1327635 RepID=A0ABU3N919_9SPHN|nr:VirB8/TrbF family protein [Sphingomonas psychrotolerans]MDT8760292.1 VirB8/TrbF family protein [Sphingomonas psychrotolerans]
MKNNAREALDAYYREAGSWAEDRQAALDASRRTAWIVAAAACVVALSEAFALIMLTPLKTVVPYTLLVDKQTGFVQTLKPLEPQQVSGNAALTQSFLVQYVIARESFDTVSLQANYRKVALWSDGKARAAYVAGMQASNPDSPLAKLPRSTVVETRVKSVSPLGNGAAMVRFDTIRNDAGGRSQEPRSWVAVIRYRYSGEPMRVEDRFINPLGFQVSHYQRSPEVLPAPEAAAPAPSPAASPTPAAPFAMPPRPAPTPSTRPTPEVEL